MKAKEEVVPTAMVMARCKDRLAVLLAMATMPQVYDSHFADMEPDYKSEWREMWANEMARRAGNIRVVIEEVSRGHWNPTDGSLRGVRSGSSGISSHDAAAWSSISSWSSSAP